MTMIRFRVHPLASLALSTGTRVVDRDRGVTLPHRVDVPLVDGEATVDLDPAGSPWTCREVSPYGSTNVITVPDTDQTIDYEDLTAETQ